MDKGEIEAKGNKQNRVQLVFPPPKKEDRKNKKIGETPTTTIKLRWTSNHDFTRRKSCQKL